MSEARSAYHDVRALKRGLRILEVLGQHGWAKPAMLSTFAGIDRSSTYRLLSTLHDAGYVVRREDDGSFALSAKIKALSDGFTDADKLSQIAAVHLHRLTEQISWPCDFAILAGGQAVIVESTHRSSPMSVHRAMIGKRRSLMTSALGQAMLCALTEDELDAILPMVMRLGGSDAAGACNPRLIKQIFKDFRDNGYAAAVGIVDTKIASIAVPIRIPASVVSAINIIFFRSALTIAQAAERYLSHLRQCAQNIHRDLAAADGEPAAPHAGLAVVTPQKLTRQR